MLCKKGPQNDNQKLFDIDEKHVFKYTDALDKILRFLSTQ